MVFTLLHEVVLNSKSVDKILKSGYVKLVHQIFSSASFFGALQVQLMHFLFIFTAFKLILGNGLNFRLICDILSWFSTGRVH